MDFTQQQQHSNINSNSKNSSSIHQNQLNPSYTSHSYNAQQQQHQQQEEALHPSSCTYNPSHTQLPIHTTSSVMGPPPPPVVIVPNPYAPHGGYVPVGSTTAAVVSSAYHDPNVHLFNQNWGHGPLGLGAAVASLYGMGQMVGNNPTARIKNMKKSLKKTKIVQSAWCDLCKVECSSQEIFNNHKLGKKHMKNLQKLEESKNVIATQPFSTTRTEDPIMVDKLPSGESARGVKTSRKRASKPEVDLETKRQKLMESGVAIDLMRVCTVCNVVCNSETVFNLHIAGQKHAAKVASAQRGMTPSTGQNLNYNPNLLPNPIPKPSLNPNPIPNPVGIAQANPPTTDGSIMQEKEKEESKQPFWCAICKLDCTSQNTLDKHNTGKRHKRNLDILEKSKNGKLKRKSKAFVSRPEEDLETKKQKLLENGITADSVKVCAICKVVCNSETVYNNHLAGNKHAAMLQKQTTAAEKLAVGSQSVSGVASTSTSGPQTDSAPTTLSTFGSQQPTNATAVPAFIPQPASA